MRSDSTRQSEIWPKYSLIPSLVTRYSILKDSRAVLHYCIDKLFSAGTNSSFSLMHNCGFSLKGKDILAQQELT